jgi:hypothetical protein
VVTLLVDDLDERLTAAAAAGIELGPVETVLLQGHRYGADSPCEPGGH